MSTTIATGADAAFDAHASRERSRRWMVLAVAALAQLMIALDATVVSIALPSAQHALHASDAERQWVVTAYALAFGSLLLPGGRLADTLGRKRAFLLGLLGFATASAAAGAAPDFVLLVAARAAQGACAALLAPTVLSLLAVTFTEPRDRAKAFALYGTIAGSGAAIGLVLGGAVTQFLAWRWCLYLNVPIAAAAAAGGATFLPRRRTPSTPFTPAIPLDLLGATLAATGLATLVIACSTAVSAGWGSPIVLGLLGAAALSWCLFVLRESRAAHPLVPLRLFRHRSRGGVYLVVALAVASMSGAYLLLTYYLQLVLHLTPFVAGLAFLPIPLASQLTSWGIASRLAPRVAPRLLMAPGALVAAAGLSLLALLPHGGGYLDRVLPAEVLLGGGIACVLVPAFSVATLDLDPRQAGVGSALVNTAQQAGASVGTALLNTIAAAVAVAAMASAGDGAEAQLTALVEGFAVAAGAGAALLAGASLATALLVDVPAPSHAPAPSPTPALRR